MRAIFQAVIFLLPSAGQAAVEYDYTGQSVGSSAAAMLSPADRLSAFFVLAAPGMTGDYTAASFLDYGASIGGYSISKASGADAGAHLVFDTAGNLTSWSFVTGVYGVPVASPGLVEAWINSADLTPAGDRITVSYQGLSVLGATPSPPGTWTASAAPVPEPVSSVLFASGLAVLFGSQRNTRTAEPKRRDARAFRAA